MTSARSKPAVLDRRRNGAEFYFILSRKLALALAVSTDELLGVNRIRAAASLAGDPEVRRMPTPNRSDEELLEKIKSPLSSLDLEHGDHGAPHIDGPCQPSNSMNFSVERSQRSRPCAVQ